jgi:hypothetical protein
MHRKSIIQIPLRLLTEKRVLLCFSNCFVLVVVVKRFKNSCLRGWHSEEIALKLVSFWWTFLQLEERISFSKWAAILLWFVSPLHEIWGLNITPCQNNPWTKPCVCCAYEHKASTQHKSETGEEHWATCLATHFKADASPLSNNIHVTSLSVTAEWELPPKLVLPSNHNWTLGRLVLTGTQL